MYIGSLQLVIDATLRFVGIITRLRLVSNVQVVSRNKKFWQINRPAMKMSEKAN